MANEDWRRGLSEATYSQRQVAEVPVMIVVCANMPRSERRYGVRVGLYAIQDATASVMNIPAHVRPIALIAVGYPDEMPEAPPRLGW